MLMFSAADPCVGLTLPVALFVLAPGQQDMQFFGARCNLPKLLLYIMNGGRDEISGDQAGPEFPPLTSGDGPLKFDEVVTRLDEGMAWLAHLYCNTMNVIHYMHDKYNYERLQVGVVLVGVVRFERLRGGAGLMVLVCAAVVPAQLPRNLS